MYFNKINELIATEIMGWKIVKTPSILIYDDEVVWLKEDGYEIGSYDFQPSKNMSFAWQIANKLGLALIPQSNDDDSFSWYACDIEKVSYRGDEIAIRPTDGTGYSQPTAELAICTSALMIVGIDIEDVV